MILKCIIALFIGSILSGCGIVKESQSTGNTTNENWILDGSSEVKFDDDYGTHYTISESEWIQHPENMYHIILWNFDENYLLAENDSSNVDEKGLYTRIDFMQFEGMEPYTWGYCLTEYSAKSIDELLILTGPDRNNPKTGCNGFPFSRMEHVD